MNNIYNSVLAAYRQHFPELPTRQQFHFASRLYLWEQLPAAKAWLNDIRADYVAQEHLLPSLKQILEQPLPTLAQTGELRQPYFERYPLLRSYERVLFRLLFLHTVYGVDSRALLYEVLDRQIAERMYRELLADTDALLCLSSYAVNYAYLLAYFAHSSELPPVQPGRLLELGRVGYNGATAVERQLECYFYTHSILSDTLFYARPVPAQNREYYLQMLDQVTAIIGEHFDDTKLDVLYEYLVCCKILGWRSQLEPKILERTQKSLNRDDIIADRLSTSAASFQNSEHRNVLFLLSQTTYQPLLTA